MPKILKTFSTFAFAPLQLLDSPQDIWMHVFQKFVNIIVFLNTMSVFYLHKYFEWNKKLKHWTNFGEKILELSKWVGTREPTWFSTGSDRVGLIFFYKFQYELIFNPTHLESGSPWVTRGEPDWLTNPQMKGHRSGFY